MQHYKTAYLDAKSKCTTHAVSDKLQDFQVFFAELQHFCRKSFTDQLYSKVKTQKSIFDIVYAKSDPMKNQEREARWGESQNNRAIAKTAKRGAERKQGTLIKCRSDLGMRQLDAYICCLTKCWKSRNTKNLMKSLAQRTSRDKSGLPTALLRCNMDLRTWTQ